MPFWQPFTITFTVWKGAVWTFLKTSPFVKKYFTIMSFQITWLTFFLISRYIFALNQSLQCCEWEKIPEPEWAFTIFMLYSRKKDTPGISRRFLLLPFASEDLRWPVRCCPPPSEQSVWAVGWYRHLRNDPRTANRDVSEHNARLITSCLSALHPTTITLSSTSQTNKQIVTALCKPGRKKQSLTSSLSNPPVNSSALLAD